MSLTNERNMVVGHAGLKFHGVTGNPIFFLFVALIEWIKMVVSALEVSFLILRNKEELKKSRLNLIWRHIHPVLHD